MASKPRKFKAAISSGRQTVKPFSKKEADDLRLLCRKKMKSCESDWSMYQWDRNYMILHLGFNTALRIEDLLQFRVNDQIKKGYIDTKEFKTKRNKPFQLNELVAKDLADYIERNQLENGQYLFASRKGFNKPITRQQAYTIISSLAKEIGIVKKVGAHSLRKTFGKLYYEQSKDLVGLHQMIHSGKGDPTVTLIYIGMVDEEVANKRKEFYI